MQWFKKVVFTLIWWVIGFYQKVLSPMLPARCRYYPTCSNYGKQAVLWYGPMKGSWMLLKRIGRCHPLGGDGVDFVPLPLYRYHYFYVGKFPRSYGYRDHYSYSVRLTHMLEQTDATKL